LDRSDFLYVADSKLISKENMAHIHDHDGFFIGPAPMYPLFRKVFYENPIFKGFEHGCVTV